MPELPEVETIRRGLEEAILSQTIAQIKILRHDLRKPIPEDLSARHSSACMTALKRRGKYIIAALNNGYALILHLGMSGRIRIYSQQDIYKVQKHDHVIFEMANGARIVFNDPRRFGMLYDSPLETWPQEPPFNLMGPEPLGNDFSGPVLAAALNGKAAPIKTALLDQRIVAGIGNIYACEALYESRIDPTRASSSLSGAECESLAAALKNVLQKALDSGGSSLRDYQHTDGKLGYFQHFFAVYDREGQPCPAGDCNCKASGGIKRIVQSGRSTFYCPQKQK